MENNKNGVVEYGADHYIRETLIVMSLVVSLGLLSWFLLGL